MTSSLVWFSCCSKLLLVTGVDVTFFLLTLSSIRTGIKNDPLSPKRTTWVGPVCLTEVNNNDRNNHLTSLMTDICRAVLEKQYPNYVCLLCTNTKREHFPCSRKQIIKTRCPMCRISFLLFMCYCSSRPFFGFCRQWIRLVNLCHSCMELKKA